MLIEVVSQLRLLFPNDSSLYQLDKNYQEHVCSVSCVRVCMHIHMSEHIFKVDFKCLSQSLPTLFIGAGSLGKTQGS